MRNHDNRIIFFQLIARSSIFDVEIGSSADVGSSTILGRMPSTPCKHWAVRRIIACFVYSFCGIFPLRDRLFLLILLFIPSIFSSFFTTLHFTAVIPLYENHVKSTTTSLLNQSKIYVNGQQTHRSASAIQQFAILHSLQILQIFNRIQSSFPKRLF